MRLFAICCVIGVFAVAGAACGGKKDEAKPAAEAAAEAAKPAGNAAQEMAKGMEQFAKSMEQMQKGADGKTYDVVSFRELQGLLPEVSGWEMEKPKGESMTAPVKFSQAETTYTKGDARVELKIVDTAMAQMLTMPYQMFMMAGYAKETDSGYEKATKIAGYPGWEKWNQESKDAEVGLIVAQRFVVTLQGNGVDNPKVVQDFVGRLDLGKLAGLK